MLVRRSLCATSAALRLAPVARLPAASAVRRPFASQPAVASDTAPPATSAVVPAVAPPTKPAESAPKPDQKPPAATQSKSAPTAGSSVWQRTVAFFVGVAVSSVYLYWTLREDVAASTASIDASLVAFKQDAAGVNEDLRKRIAVLEHEVAALKK